MSGITEKAYAKLNISLDITGKRSDGYHDMLMVMQTVSLCDEIRIELRENVPSSARTNLHYIPEDDRNLAVRAANAFFAAAGISGVGAVMTVRKVIPVCAGMGGGSSDAAAVLRGLNKLTGAALPREKLLGIAEEIGSDVPFCVAGGTALASGRGEKLRALPPMPDCSFVIVKPEFSISTPELFRKLDFVRLRCHPDTAGLCGALERGDLDGIVRRMYNVFEDAPDRRMSYVAEIKSRLLDLGAMGAIMTGTGSAVFGVFSDAAAAASARAALSGEYKSCFTAKPVAAQ